MKPEIVVECNAFAVFERYMSMLVSKRGCRCGDIKPGTLSRVAFSPPISPLIPLPWFLSLSLPTPLDNTLSRNGGAHCLARA